VSEESRQSGPRWRRLTLKGFSAFRGGQLHYRTDCAERSISRSIPMPAPVRRYRMPSGRWAPEWGIAGLFDAIHKAEDKRAAWRLLDRLKRDARGPWQPAVRKRKPARHIWALPPRSEAPIEGVKDPVAELEAYQRVAEQELLREIRAKLGSAPRLREAFELRYCSALPWKKVARRMGLKDGGKSTFHALRRKLAFLKKIAD
jgi:hypothetical protein